MDIDLQQFCSTDAARPYLHKPFSRGEFTYATNGHVAVRIPRLPGIGEQEKPAVEKVFADSFDARPKGVLKVSLPEIKVDEIDCEECNGSGNEHECPNCTCECDYCGGTGKVEHRTKVAVKVGAALFDAYYIKAILTLPGLKFAAEPDKEKAAPFVFDGGDGLLMPMRYIEGKPILATVELKQAQAASERLS